MPKIIYSRGFHRVSFLFTVGLYFQMGSFEARAEDFCAVTGKVVLPDGRPITSTWIELVDPTGQLVLREMIRQGEFRICDFGFGAHTLRVGTNECFPIAISNLRVVLGHPVFLRVVLNSCIYRELVRSSCLGYFRTVDSNGKPVPGVEFSPQLNLPARTDTFGRWQGVFSGSHSLLFTKADFAPRTVHVQCRDDEEVDLEVVLTKSTGREGK